MPQVRTACPAACLSLLVFAIVAIAEAQRRLLRVPISSKRVSLLASQEVTHAQGSFDGGCKIEGPSGIRAAISVVTSETRVRFEQITLSQQCGFRGLEEQAVREGDCNEN